MSRPTSAMSAGLRVSSSFRFCAIVETVEDGAGGVVDLAEGGSGFKPLDLE
jgi:hypothetical protein